MPTSQMLIEHVFSQPRDLLEQGRKRVYRILSIKPPGGLFFSGPFKEGGGLIGERGGGLFERGAYLFIKKII